MKLTKTECKELDNLISRMDSAHENLGVEPGQASVDDYNVIMEEAASFCKSIASKIEEYMDGKSDAWQDSDAAESYGAWMDQWSEIEFDTITLEDLEGGVVDNPSDQLSDLPTEPEL